MDVPEADRPHMSVMIGAQYWAARAAGAADDGEDSE